MLVHLSIRDIVLIERLDLALGEGLSVLTGETGAGKSILLDALSLALGGRGDGGLVRHGAKQGEVTAVFDLPAGFGVRTLLDENGFDDDGDVILRRVQSADGRTRGFINDRPASVALMRQVGQALVEIHGQHADRALVDPEAHRTLLDQYGGLEREAAAVAGAHAAWRSTEQELRAHRARVEAAAREADYIRAAVEELSDLAPIAGEEDELAERRQIMMRSEKIVTDVNDAHEELSGSASPIPPLAGLLKRLDRKRDQLPGLLDPTIERLDVALDALSDAQMALQEALRSLEFDPRALEETEERLFALRAAGRKFSVPVDALPELTAKMIGDLADLDAGEERLARLEAELAEKRTLFDRNAAALSEQRQEAARLLEAAVMAELPDLKLDRAAFLVEMASDPDRPSAAGIDTVEFYVRTNPGTRAGAMMKVASGGELSRFLLALKVALADRGSAPTLVFDEIDTGVGGAVADAIGRRLARLAGTVQVLAVTHAPQVAARAATHLLISKAAADAGEDRVATRVAPIGEAGRREEIARMLAGETVTDEARAAAERLIGAGA
ncbi:DNA repair protein RecN [Aurantimonas sp. C2-6-R+9]|uniref:DNA repair protein RecN n=1 Tax=unclassified Aurantimonas TaxID=2638230 RepID=UPI002E192D8A|nr:MULTISPECIES: DNA repair protein RecN [unclassified Aurantimonas]MEC5290032.1 DNA repair protein RecN [Aurantimonas sp. C2-3-R2]MEC5381796.1 DNA repair protein RecN [Aurantimonas sp. C2-6-R+9]MEC5411097.1 DNA repair protein RecN [Aurantimonas sp. C2-4-R8]